MSVVAYVQYHTLMKIIPSMHLFTIGNSKVVIIPDIISAVKDLFQC